MLAILNRQTKLIADTRGPALQLTSPSRIRYINIFRLSVDTSKLKTNVLNRNLKWDKDARLTSLWGLSFARPCI